MDAFYRLAALDYRLLAEEVDWLKLFKQVASRHGHSFKLLDVACGSGQFPSALLNYGGLKDSESFSVAYSLLDPSDFSIQTTRQKLGDPLQPFQEHCCTIQDFDPSDVRYAIVLATHALYCVPQFELRVAVDRMLAALETSGLGFIAHASEESHYVGFHDLYLESGGTTSATPYSTGEQLIQVLQERTSIKDVQTWSIDYEGQLAFDDKETAERYLQRCLFDDSLSLDDMMTDRLMGEHLRACIDTSNNIWRFPQKVWLIFFGEMAKSIGEYRHA